MTVACTESGCGGTIAPDGYCDTCGAKPAPSDHAVASPAPTGSSPPGPPGSATGASPVRAVGAACGRDGCIGSIAPDGYCDTCGLAAGSAGGGPATAPGALSSAPDLGGTSVVSSIAAPEAPDTSSRLSGAGTATARSRRTASSRRTATTRRGIGAGLVQVVPTPVGDPAQAVMSAEKIASVLGEVPEDDRFCSSCGRPVGRSTAEREGRVKGFCGTCRTPFDFVTNEPALASGELVAGQYEILGPLAHGGMGWIYLGRDKAVSDRWVVLKGLLNESDPDAALAAVAERQFLAQIEHPNIVNIYNFVTHRGAGYIVMEMVGGESLNAKLKARRRANGGIPDPLPVADAIAYILGILPAFGYLHGHGLVYNDLKPANVMAVGDDVKLIDVGAVMRADDQQAAIFGTQGFQAPEVASVGPSAASDLYTVGRTLAVLIIRFVFHDGRYLHALPPATEEPLFGQWESLYRFLLRATAFHPDDRFQTAAAMSQQLTGVLREIVALSTGEPRSTPSELFGPDQLTALLVGAVDDYDPTGLDWRILPSPKVDPDDPAAAFLLDLPDLDPERSLELIDAGLADGQLPATVEVQIRQAQELIEAGRSADGVLTAIEEADPWEWRTHWYRAVQLLRAGRGEEAAEAFSRVWTELPGETAPKLAVAVAAEQAGAFDRAAQLYDLVISTDATFVSAAFGLARCRRALDDPAAAVAAFGRVPASSAAHHDAQIASARTLVAGGPSGAPTAGELATAATTIERLQLDAAQRAELSADIFERALAGLETGQITSGAGSLLGRPLDARSLRVGLEETYRVLARLAVDSDERVRLVDRANRVRPRSLV